MKPVKKIFLRCLMFCCFLAALAFFSIRHLTYQPSRQAQKILQSSRHHETADYEFFASQGKKKATLLFYNGALVDEKSYALLAEGLSDRGYDVYLIKAPLNLPILAQKKAAAIIKSQKLKAYYLAGHSLGGVTAAMNAQTRLSDSHFKGLIFLASYPGQKTNFRQTELAVLSITASKDRILNWKNYQKAKKQLPQKTHYVTIKGGNHSGFGLYGQQRKDGTATISAKKQQLRIIQLIDQFISKTN